MTDTDTANSITLAFLQAPVLLVLDPETHYYYMSELYFDKMSPESVSSFLKGVKNGEIEV